MEHFNYQQYREGFRAACRRRGIDPLQGANSYQVALYNAEQAKAKARKQVTGWWKRGALWYENDAIDPPTGTRHSVSTSMEYDREGALGNSGHAEHISRPVERAVFRHIFNTAYAAELSRVLRAIARQHQALYR